MEPRSTLYRKNDPLGYCGEPKRGAAMGRGMTLPKAEELAKRIQPIQMFMSHIQLDSGGYDCCGTYWGGRRGYRYYWAHDREANLEVIVEGRTRKEASTELMRVLADHNIKAFLYNYRETSA